MQTWKIPVVWQEMGVVEIEADTLAEAIKIANDEEENIPLPDNGEYLSGTWEVDCSDDGLSRIRELYNGGQEDE